MTDALTDAAEPDDPSPDVAEACAAGGETRDRERLAALRELTEIGMRLARKVEQQADDPDAEAGNLGLLFARFARAVRQTLALEARLAGDQQEQLFEALDERLGDRQDDEDFLDRPIGELVALICKDPGVSCDLTLWEDEAWTRAEAALPAQPPPDAAPAPPAPRLAPPAGVPSWLSG